jgi:L-cysteine desulfidase
MSGKRLTLLQTDALISLASGWRWGIDHRTAESLRRRGLVTLSVVTLRNGSKVKLPALTAAGLPIAVAIRATAISTSHNVVMLERQTRGLPLFGERA